MTQSVSEILDDWKANDKIRAARAGTIAALGETGRVLLRPSGTEPVLRVMVEAREADVADKHAQDAAHEDADEEERDQPVGVEAGRRGVRAHGGRR